MIEETTLNALRLNVELATHLKTGNVWIGNKKRTVLHVTDQWIYYRVHGNGRTKRCRKATWRTWCIKYAAYVANSEVRRIRWSEAERKLNVGLCQHP